MGEITISDIVKGGTIAAFTTSPKDKKVFYVLTYLGVFSGKKHYVGQNDSNTGWMGCLNVKGAKRFGSVSAAILFTRDSAHNADGQYFDLNINIVRVEETPGTSTVRLVSTTKIDATKPVVFFDGERGVYAAQGVTGPLNSPPYGTLQTARVFSDLNDALTVLQEQRIATIERRGVNRGLTIHQVEVVPGTPTVTETVLA